ncbi:MAG: glycosyltransferase family 2 protein, partial [Oscillospiraceae bacterium]|nr:glycosyltransferase family 2 protein [Oscillospiraceae bacterium]
AKQDSLGGMAKRLLNPGHVAQLFGWAGRTVKEEGFEYLWRELDFRVSLAMHKDKWQHRADIPTGKQLKYQKAHPITGPKISVVVPMYNTPLRFLKEMMESVQGQTYPNWELVLADASDENHAEGSAAAQRAAEKDSRIVYKKLEENKGIAGNTNAGFALASGEYLALLDHDDLLYKNALYEVVQEINKTGADFVYSDEIILSADLKELGGYHFKPDFAPDNLRGCNYITHLAVFSRGLAEEAGFEERSEFDGAQDHDLILRLTEKAECIRHIPKVMYIWRGHAASTAAGMEAKPYAVAAGERAVKAQLDRLGLAGSVKALEGAPGAFRVSYELTGEPLISVMIPNKDHIDDLERCLSTLYAKAGYGNFEVLVLENNSTDPATFAYYETLPEKYPRCRVERYEGSFNFSAVNNFGERFARGEQLLLLNNDIEILTDGFLKEMLSYSQRPDVGCVGAKLFYPDDTIQHGGVIMGINKTAGHSHKGHPRDAVGDLYRLITTQDFMAVTGACLMVKRELYRACGGLDEEKFAVAYNDIDLCLKLWEQGLLNVYTPFAQGYHYESKSRGLDESGPNAQRYAVEKQNFIDKYGYLIDAGDPYYNPHFNNKFENFGLR